MRRVVGGVAKHQTVHRRKPVLETRGEVGEAEAAEEDGEEDEDEEEEEEEEADEDEEEEEAEEEEAEQKEEGVSSFRFVAVSFFNRGRFLREGQVCALL